MHHLQYHQTGFATFKSASIAGFIINDISIYDSSKTLVMSSSGQITGSNVLFTGGKIAGWDIDSDEIKSGTNISLHSSNRALTINDATFGNTGIQLEYNSGTPRFFAGKSTGGFVKFDGSNVHLSSSAFMLGDTGSAYVSGSNGNLSISSSNFYLSPDGSVIMTGTVSASAGNIGTWTINSSNLSSPDGGVVLDASNKAVYVNDSTFGNTGIQLQHNSGTPRAFIGKSTGGYIKFDGTDVNISSSAFMMGNTGSAYISGSEGQLEISSSNFFLKSDGSINAGAGDFTIDTSGNVTMAGNISATTGDIGGFVIGANDLWGGNAAIGNVATTIVMGNLDGTSKIALGATADSLSLTSGTGFYADGGGDFRVGKEKGVGISFDQSEGLLIMSSSTFLMGVSGSEPTTGAYISGSNGNIEISSSQFFLKENGSLNMGAGDFTIDTSGNVTMAGTVTATAGTIGGFTIDSDEIKSGTNIGMNSNTKAFTINDTTFGNTGIQLEYNSGTPRFYVGDGSNKYLKFDGTDVDIKTDTFTLDTTNLDINSATKRIEVSDGSNIRVRIGEVDSTVANHYGITIYDGTGTAASDEIVHLSDAKYQIASWSLSPTQITSENLILDSAGIIQTSDFVSGVQGLENNFS